MLVALAIVRWFGRLDMRIIYGHILMGLSPIPRHSRLEHNENSTRIPEALGKLHQWMKNGANKSIWHVMKFKIMRV